MVYKFLLVSDEVDNFVREIRIDSDATFLQLHDAILESVNYSKDQMTSFFLCEDDWEKTTEITLMEMDNSPEYDSWVMSETTLGELIEEEKQKLLFVFDYLTERSFFMELREIEVGVSLAKAECSRSEGEAPSQMEELDLSAPPTAATSSPATAMDPFDDHLYGDDHFDISEIDEEGFSNFNEGEDPYSF